MYESLIDALLRAPEVIADGLALLGKELFAKRASPEEWSQEEIFEHLRASDSIIAPRVYHVLLRPGTLMPAADERRWADLVRTASVSIEDRLSGYAILRQQLVGVLQSLGPSGWSVAGHHEDKGEMTVHDLVKHLVFHESQHLAQMIAVRKELGK